jgi:hypothetical protein
LKELLAKVKEYDWGQSRLALTEISETVKKAHGNKAELAKIEKALLGTLPDAKQAGRQFLCRELSIIGTEQSVPVLAKMLAGEKTSDMARYALERIPGAAVDQALRKSLKEAKGKAKIGIVNSLGQRSKGQGEDRYSQLIGSTRRQESCPSPDQARDRQEQGARRRCRRRSRPDCQPSSCRSAGRSKG